MTDIIFGAILVVIVGAAALYVHKAKKRGVKCIGCPAGENGCCSCSSHGEGGAASGHGCGCSGGTNT